VLRKILLPSICLVLGYGFWVSPDFKEIAAGVAIFLFGMLSLEEGFRAFTGGVLEKILKRTTDKVWKSVAFGVVTTTIMQSSSLVSVITISFLSAGLLGLGAGIGIIFGANLGTTTGAWLVAGFGLKVKISAYAMPMLVFGVIMVFQRSKVLKGIGYVLAGLGFLFLGIHHMKEGFEAFKDTLDLAQFAVAGYPGLFLFAGIGVFATVVMQSSHATLVLIITALAAGQITYENALALAIGANVGTTITAIIGAMSANEQGKRLAAAHLIFNVVTGVIAILFISQFMLSVDWVSQMTGIAADDHTLKLAVFHTLFNLAGVVVMLPLINRMVSFLEGTFASTAESVEGPRYLDDASMDFPDTAVEVVRKETLHVFDNAVELIANGIQLPVEKILSQESLEQIVTAPIHSQPLDFDHAYEHNIKGIHSAIIAFISKAPFSWEMGQSGEIHWLRNANRSIVEAIKDVKHLRKNLIRYVRSPNADIRSEYDAIRMQIAAVLRELERLRHDEDEEDPILSLDALKATIEENDVMLNQRLVGLIRDGKITAQMGTSLMNDSSYAYDICRNLLDMGGARFVTRDRDQTSVERQLALSEDELAAVNAEND
jgi:phosphate:Na+ symporter